MNMDGDSYKEHKKDKRKHQKKNSYFNREQWPESIKQEFLWFLFQHVLSFTAKSIPENSDFLLVQ